MFLRGVACFFFWKTELEQDQDKEQDQMQNQNQNQDQIPTMKSQFRNQSKTQFKPGTQNII